MEEKVKQLQEKLENNLEQIGREGDLIRKCAQSLNTIEGILKDLFTYTRSYSFADTADEVAFFKVHAPYFFSKYLYYQKVQQLEILEINSTVDNFKGVLKRELDQIDLFANGNGDFLAIYYRSSQTEDERIFTRSKNCDNWILNDFSPVVERNFPPPTTKVAIMLANREIRLYIAKILDDLEMPKNTSGNCSLGDFGWEGASKAAAWELLNKLAEKKIIYYKGEPADKKKVAEFARLALNLNLGNFYEIDRKNRVRKKDKLPFLKSLLLDSGPASESPAAE